MGINSSQSKTAEVIRAVQSDLNHKRVNAIFFSRAKLLTDVVSRPNALSVTIGENMIQIQGGRRIPPPHVGYGNRDANGDLRPRHCQTKTVCFLFLMLGVI